MHNILRTSLLRSTLALFFTCFLSFSAFAQPTQVENILRSPNPQDPTIPYLKYTLPNGLTILLHQDRSDPMVHVDVTYHVGSAREEIGKSGFAHFFEHMMFQGSKNVKDEEHFGIVNRAGGRMNGTTNRDRTNYFETLPKNYLETALWLESDRMGFLLDSVTQRKFEVQRATVKNEKGQRYENQPYGMAGENISMALYPIDHPYHWPTIGYVEDLDRVGLEDLKKFFLRWYGPNNATLTIAGDFDIEPTLKLIDKYFGSIPMGPAVEKQTVEPVVLTGPRYISLEDNVRFPQLRITYPTVPIYSQNDAPLDILSEMIGQGKSSLLDQTLVKTGKLYGAVAYHSSYELAGEFTVVLTAFPGTSLARVKKMYDSVLNAKITEYISKDILDGAITQRIANSIFGLETINGKAAQLASYQTFAPTANFSRGDVARFAQTDLMVITKVFNQYIRNANPVILSIVPKGQSALIAAPDNFKPVKRDESKVMAKSAFDSLQPRPAKDKFKRSKAPKIAKSPTYKLPPFSKLVGPLGDKGLFASSNELPITNIRLLFNAGEFLVPTDKRGLASLMVEVAKEGTETQTAEQLEKELNKLGASLSIYTTTQHVVVEIQAMTDKMMPALSVAMGSIIFPAFKEEDLERAKKKRLEGIANLPNNASAIANIVFQELIFGKTSPMGQYSSGNKASISSITVEDLKAFHTKHINAQNVSVVITGNISEPDRMNLMAVLGGLPAGMAVEPFNDKPMDIKPRKGIYLVNKPNAPQSEIRVGHRSRELDFTGPYFISNLVNGPLGGNFNSRINQNLRERRGFTYGARSGFSGNTTAGYFQVSAAVKANTTDSAITEILKEIELYIDKGPSKDEINTAKNAMLEKEALSYESLAAKSSLIENILLYSLPADYKDQQGKIVSKMNKSKAKKVAKEEIRPDDLIIVVVGDAATLKPKLEKLGWQVYDYSYQE